MSQASTKIEDLPDNNKETSSQILQELNDDISQTSDEEYTTPKETKKLLKNNKGFSYINWEHVLKYGKDALIVFVIIFIISNNNIISVISNLPYIKSYEPHSIIYNIIISLIVSLLYFITKYSSYIYSNL